MTHLLFNINLCIIVLLLLVELLIRKILFLIKHQKNPKIIKIPLKSKKTLILLNNLSCPFNLLNSSKMMSILSVYYNSSNSYRKSNPIIYYSLVKPHLLLPLLKILIEKSLNYLRMLSPVIIYSIY